MSPPADPPESKALHHVEPCRPSGGAVGHETRQHYGRQFNWLLVVAIGCLGLPLAVSGYEEITTTVKIFDATNPSTTFCAAATPSAKAGNRMLGSDSTTSTKAPAPYPSDGFPAALHADPFSAIYDIANLALASLIHDSLTANDSALHESADDETKAVLRELQTNPEAQEKLQERLHAALLPEGSALYPSAAACDASDADSGNCPAAQQSKTSLFDMLLGSRSSDEGSGYSSLEDLSTSMMMVEFVSCIIQDNSKSLTWDLQINSRLRNIGMCLCRGLQLGFTKGDSIGDGCSFVDLLIQGASCRSFGDINCNSGVPPVIPPSGFDSCTDAQIPTGSASTDPDVDYDLYLVPRSEIVAEGDTFPEVLDAAISTDEGLTYYYLFRAVMRATKFTQAAMCGSEALDTELVPGWQSELLINSRHEGDEAIELSGRGSIPFVIVSRRGCDVLLTIRGTSTSFEWRMNFSYAHIFGSQSADLPSGGVHLGFGSMAASVVPAFTAYYSKMFEDNNCKEASTMPRIILTGHSLGGGVATVLAHFIAAVVKDSAHVEQVLFAAPAALGPDAVDSGEINSRSIRSELDAVPYLPCAVDTNTDGLMLCANGKVKNAPEGEFVKYKKIPGLVEITTESLKTLAGDDERWVSRNILDISVPGGATGTLLEASPLQFWAHHMCAYACHTGQFCRSSTSTTWSCSDGVSSVEPCSFTSKSL